MSIRSSLSIADRSVSLPSGMRLSYADIDKGHPGTGRPHRDNPIVCLHAVSHGSRDFEALIERITSRGRIIAIDWPGHGNSESDSQPTAAIRYEEILGEVLDALELDCVAIVGNSIGGAAAIRYAARNPARVEALVVCDSGGLVAPNAVTRSFCRAMAWVYRRATRGARWFDAFYRLQYRALLTTAPAAEQRARIVAAGRSMAPVLADAWASFATPANDVRPYVADVQCRVLLAWAKRDPYNAYSAARTALAEFKDAETCMFPGGHTPFLEDPDAFAEALVRFLDAREESRPSDVADGLRVA